MKRQLNYDKIARILGAERGGEMTAGSGYFAACQLAAEVRARSSQPKPHRQESSTRAVYEFCIYLSPRLMRKLEAIAAKAQEEGLHVEVAELASEAFEDSVRRLTAKKAIRLIRECHSRKEQGR
jgi:hypothetical protein